MAQPNSDLISFTRNYRDASNDQGFQFEFFCDKCGNGFQSPYEQNKMGMLAGLCSSVASLSGSNRMWRMAHAGAYVKDGLRGSKHDQAYKSAVNAAKKEFHQCGRCGLWVCPKVCWNPNRQLCQNCAPNVANELASAQASAAKEQIWQHAQSVNQIENLNQAAGSTALCRRCGTRSTGKFCGTCGSSLASASPCVQCRGPVEVGARFCNSCGAQQIQAATQSIY